MRCITSKCTFSVGRCVSAERLCPLTVRNPTYSHYSTSSAYMTNIQFDYEKKLFSQISPASVKPVTGNLTEKKKQAFASIKAALKELKFDFDTNCFDEKNKLPPVIHVAGTKGKGSVSSFTESILRNHGLRTGLFTSPHLIDVRERVKINGKFLKKQKMQEYVDTVFDVLFTKAAFSNLGFFRLMTVLALYIFSQEKLDVIILEVGIGGLLDSTNVLNDTAVSAVTLLDYDHVDFLGGTIESIAAQKAGIYKIGSIPLTITSQCSAAMNVLESTCHALGLELVKVGPDYLSKYSNLKLGLAGNHQLVNAALAVQICENFMKTELVEDKLREGLANTKYFGRCQVLRAQETSFFLDGAHTEKSMQAAVTWLEDQKVDPVALFFNCAHTKDVKALLQVLQSANVQFKKAYFVKPNSFKPSSKPLPDLKELIGQEETEILTWQQKQSEIWRFLSADCDIVVHHNIDDCIEKILHDKVENVFVTGSFLLVGDVLKKLKFDIENQ